MLKTLSLKAALGLMTLAAIAGCGSTPANLSQGERDVLRSQVRDTIAEYRNVDTGMDRFFSGAHAYAVFPEVTSAAVGVGGAHGDGLVLRNGQVIGRADVSKGNVGVQLGAQTYSQIVFFENDSTFADFRDGKLAFDAKISAVAADKGASNNANYEKGVVVFTRTKGGLMAQAAVGGQKFRFTPIDRPYALEGDMRGEMRRDTRDLNRDMRDTSRDVNRDLNREMRDTSRDLNRDVRPDLRDAPR